MTNNSQNLANLAKLAQAEAQKRENLMLEREPILAELRQRLESHIQSKNGFYGTSTISSFG